MRKIEKIERLRKEKEEAGKSEEFVCRFEFEFVFKRKTRWGQKITTHFSNEFVWP